MCRPCYSRGCPSCEVGHAVHTYPEWQCDRHALELGLIRESFVMPPIMLMPRPTTWPELVAELLDRGEPVDVFGEPIPVEPHP